MLRLLSDEDFNRRIVRGMRRRQPGLDLVQAQDVGLSGMEDPLVLEWAANNDRIILTHDENTMTAAATERLRHGQPMAGVFVVPQWVSIGQAIDDLLVLDGASEQDDWNSQIVWLPL
jgi:predicted nuclease of predicted toxin-antitoxin system